MLIPTKYCMKLTNKLLNMPNYKIYVADDNVIFTAMHTRTRLSCDIFHVDALNNNLSYTRTR